MVRDLCLSWKNRRLIRQHKNISCQIVPPLLVRPIPRPERSTQHNIPCNRSQIFSPTHLLYITFPHTRWFIVKGRPPRFLAVNVYKKSVLALTTQSYERADEHEHTSTRSSAHKGRSQEHFLPANTPASHIRNSKHTPETIRVFDNLEHTPDVLPFRHRQAHPSCIQPHALPHTPDRTDTGGSAV